MPTVNRNKTYTYMDTFSRTWSLTISLTTTW